MNGRISRIQRCCVHDGPGIRTTVFFQGCPLSCAWCHNPETRKQSAQLMFNKNLCIGCRECLSACPHGAQQWTEKGRRVEFGRCLACGVCCRVCPTHALEISGLEMTVDRVMGIVERDEHFYGREGGVTFSGGDPLLQGEFLAALLRACRSRGIHTVVDTCGFGPTSLLSTISPDVGLFLFDVKHAYSECHRRGTGVDNDLILANLRFLIESGKAVRIRIPLVPGYNDSDEDLRSMAHRLRPWHGRIAVDILPFNRYGSGKYEAIGEPTPAFDVVSDAVFEARKKFFFEAYGS